MKYRELKIGETIKIGDQRLIRYPRHWMQVASSIGITVTQLDCACFRRPIKEKKKKAKKKLVLRKTRAHKKGTNK